MILFLLARAAGEPPDTGDIGWTTHRDKLDNREYTVQNGEQ
jgi:hypothetical protein